MKKTGTPYAKSGFYRAQTATGWAVYCKTHGFARPATEAEARTAGDMEGKG